MLEKILEIYRSIHLPVPHLKGILAIIVLSVILYWFFRLFRSFFRMAFAFLTNRGCIATVMHTIDGDTIKVRNGKDEFLVRMIGVDTPESKRSLYMNIAPFGHEAAAYTKKRMTKGRKVVLLYDKAKHDKFGRVLAYVFLPNGEFYNKTLIRLGYAFPSVHPPNVKYAKEFEAISRKAKRRKRNLWNIYEAKGQLDAKYKKSKDYKAFKRKYDS